MQQIDVIRLKPAQTPLNDPHRFVAVPRIHFGGEKDALASLRHDLAYPGLALAIPVAVCGIDVGDAEVESFRKRGKGLFLVLVGKETAAGTERQNRDSLPGLAECTHWHTSFRVSFCCGKAFGSYSGDCSRLEKAASRDPHIRRILRNGGRDLRRQPRL